MNCWHCKTQLVWGGDEDLDDEGHPKNNAEYSMLTNLSCPKCFSLVEVYKRRDAYD